MLLPSPLPPEEANDRTNDPPVRFELYLPPTSFSSASIEEGGVEEENNEVGKEDEGRNIFDSSSSRPRCAFSLVALLLLSCSTSWLLLPCAVDQRQPCCSCPCLQCYSLSLSLRPRALGAEPQQQQQQEEDEESKCHWKPW